MNKKGELTKADLIKHIKKQLKADKERKDYYGECYYNFLGFVENKELTEEVKSYFTFKNKEGLVIGYDWVNGNDKLKELIKTM